MKQVKTSMCTTMCCSMMNMSMYMHSMCKTQHSALKENSNIDFNFSFTKLGRVFHEINFNVKDNYKKNNNKQNLKLSEKMKILRKVQMI